MGVVPAGQSVALEDRWGAGEVQVGFHQCTSLKRPLRQLAQSEAIRKTSLRWCALVSIPGHITILSTQWRGLSEDDYKAITVATTMSSPSHGGVGPLRLIRSCKVRCGGVSLDPLNFSLVVKGQSD